jgi:hypothetical protein
MSDSLSLVRIDVVEGWDLLGQKLFFSGGEGFDHISNCMQIK